MQIRNLIPLAGMLVLLAAVPAQAFDLADSLSTLLQEQGEGGQADTRIAQNKGMTLAEAIESVRRRTDGRIVSAETRIQGNREVHHIKVLTRDGKVKTHKVQGRKVGSG